MRGSIVEITQGNRHLHLDRGFLVIREEKKELARFPLDAIESVIVHSFGITYSHNILVEFSRRNIPLILCDDHHKPAAFLWSVEGNHRQAGRMHAQAQADLPLRKRLWKQIVRAKIKAHIAVLKFFEIPQGPLVQFVRQVRSGDPSNMEAQAAHFYWPLLFGKGFIRDRGADGVNALLNYGSIVLRAACARAVMATGLHPSLGIHHRGASNNFQLADDLMEPFRPFVDWQVKRLVSLGETDLIPEVKKKLIRVISLRIKTSHGDSELATCLEKFAVSLAQIYEGKRKDLELPDFLNSLFDFE